MRSATIPQDIYGANILLSSQFPLKSVRLFQKNVRLLLLKSYLDMELETLLRR